MLAVDWVAVSSILTAAATLVLAVATFASVRSANRAARAAERSLLAGLRPVLVPTRPDDPPVKVGFQDDKWFAVDGGRAVAEVTEGAIYLAIALRNVGSGIAVLHGWVIDPEERRGDAPHAPLEDFHRLTRDIYIAPGDLGFWQGTFRDPSSERFEEARTLIESGDRFMVEVLYGDHELGQRSISRFAFAPRDGGGYHAVVGRHWNVDRPDPRA